MAIMIMATRDKILRVPCPLSPLEMPSVGRNVSNVLSNGDRAIARSRRSHGEPMFRWQGTRAEMRPILDMFAGVYGPGPYYFIDPFALDGNVLPLQWSMPRLGVQQRGGGAVMEYEDRVTFPSSGVVKLANPHEAAQAYTGMTGLPARSLRATFPKDSNTRVPDMAYPAGGQPFFAIPIPAGWTGRLDVWGVQELYESPVKYQLCNVGTVPTNNAAATAVTLSSSGTSVMITSSLTDRFFYLWLSVGTAGAGAAVAKVGAMSLRLGPDGYLPDPPLGDFPFGRGYMPFDLKSESLQITGYGLFPDKIAVTADCSEVYLPW